MQKPTIDLNADFGEGYGSYAFGDDAALLGSITSASIACGWHAGDARTMRTSVERCLLAGVAVGAHPGYPDRQGFGRRAMALDAEEVYEAVLYQTGALQAFVRAAGGELRHIKPHGAMYHRCGASQAHADAVARAAAELGGLALFGPPGGLLERAAVSAGLPFAAEGFADRAYLPDGSLAGRDRPGAVHGEPSQALEQALTIALRGEAPALGGGFAPVAARTLCLHGDGPGAAELAALIRAGLEAAGVAVRAPWQP
ncbi:LamB/YcsF family protein [Paenibacillus pasadenensis]|uniref:Lactam utilization protein LamB n=1 Tax=Paenibacillus pasadenensis TaxID=217090 RepID=A0A2N5N402_9BACL|nr:5-oxoprolinase subunit PxpA [Paenibacillus pasadenensis]PLT45063.1 Lactam utilization protein LamB [Paenibacillus pasadenensis]